MFEKGGKNMRENVTITLNCDDWNTVLAVMWRDKKANIKLLEKVDKTSYVALVANGELA